MAGEDSLAWAKSLVDRGAVVLHIPTQTVGLARKLFDGHGEQYVSTVDKKPVGGAVLELEPGHAFVANPDSFVELPPDAVRFMESVVEAVGEVLRVEATRGAASGLRPATMSLLIGIALRSQAASLDKERARHNDGDGHQGTY